MKPAKPEKGTVVAITGGKATVRLAQSEDCKACGLCHFHNDDSSTGNTSMLLEVDALPELDVGSTVLVSDATPSAWAGSLLLFLLPLLGLLAGVLAGMTWFGDELVAAGTGLLGLALALSGGFVAERLMFRRPQPRPRIVRMTAMGPQTDASSAAMAAPSPGGPLDR